jgi:hypothetical protein
MPQGLENLMAARRRGRSAVLADSRSKIEGTPMLWNASSIKGYVIKASDGLIGTVSDLRFQDSDWAINWLEIDKGTWLPGRAVLIPTSAVGQPDPETRQLVVNLTMGQIEDSPNPDTGLPYSTASEARLYEHYGLPTGRDRSLWESADVADNVKTLEAPAVSPAKRLGVTDSEGHENHLHSMDAVIGNAVEATDGTIGHAEDFLIDTTTWQIRYLTVHTSDWWIGQKVLISPGSIFAIDRINAILHLNVTRQKVKDSPPYVAAETVDGAYDETFHAYYGIRRMKL